LGSRNEKLCASIVLIVAVLLGSQGLAEQLRVAENLRQGQVMMPASVPERSLMTIVDHIMFVDSGIAAILIFYDDKTTGRDLDYVEVYDIEGDLLLLSWIDQMGVC
jgi:tryptophan-rich sensory protein